jgi:hypothetical protein
MYKDELWYRKLVRDIEEHRPDFTDKQLRVYQVDLMLRTALRVKDASDTCETCRDFQRTLSRMEEEFQELPESKAQRHYQAQQLRLMAEHFVKAHRLAPPRYYTRLYANYGIVAGLLFGIGVGLLVLNNGLYLPLGVIVGVGLGAAYGSSEDASVKREHRLI